MNVKEDVTDVVVGAVRRAVDWRVGGFVGWPVRRAVNRRVEDAVYWSVEGAVQDEVELL